MSYSQVLELVQQIEAGQICGSRDALDRIRKSRIASYRGRNRLGDKCYFLGRLPREHTSKTLYLHPFKRKTASGALFRAYVQSSP